MAAKTKATKQHQCPQCGSRNTDRIGASFEINNDMYDASSHDVYVVDACLDCKKTYRACYTLTWAKNIGEDN